MLGHSGIPLSEINKYLTIEEVHRNSRISKAFNEQTQKLSSRRGTCSTNNVDGALRYYFECNQRCPSLAREKTLDDGQRCCLIEFGSGWGAYLGDTFKYSTDIINRILSICGKNTNVFGLICLLSENRFTYGLLERLEDVDNDFLQKLAVDIPWEILDKCIVNFEFDDIEEYIYPALMTIDGGTANVRAAAAFLLELLHDEELPIEIDDAGDVCLLWKGGMKQTTISKLIQKDMPINEIVLNVLGFDVIFQLANKGLMAEEISKCKRFGQDQLKNFILPIICGYTEDTLDIVPIEGGLDIVPIEGGLDVRTIIQMLDNGVAFENLQGFKGISRDKFERYIKPVLAIFDHKLIIELVQLKVPLATILNLWKKRKADCDC